MIICYYVNLNHGVFSCLWKFISKFDLLHNYIFVLWTLILAVWLLQETGIIVEEQLTLDKHEMVYSKLVLITTCCKNSYLI